MAKQQARNRSVRLCGTAIVFVTLIAIAGLPASGAPITEVAALSNSPAHAGVDLPLRLPVNLDDAGRENADRVLSAVQSDVFMVPESDTATMILLGLLLCGGGIFLKRRFQPTTALESDIRADNTSGDSPFRLER